MMNERKMAMYVAEAIEEMQTDRVVELIEYLLENMVDIENTTNEETKLLMIGFIAGYLQSA